MASSTRPAEKAASPQHAVEETVGEMRKAWMLRGGAQGKFADFVPKDDYARQSLFARNVESMQEHIKDLPEATKAPLQTALQEYNTKMRAHHDGLLEGVGFDEVKFSKDHAALIKQVNDAKATLPAPDTKQADALKAFNDQIATLQKDVFAKEMQRLQQSLEHQQQMHYNEAVYRNTYGKLGSERAAELQFTKLTGQSPHDNAEMQKHNRNVDQQKANSQAELVVSNNDFTSTKGGFGIYNAGDSGYQINYQQGKHGISVSAQFKTPQKSTWQLFRDVIKDVVLIAAVTATAPVSLPLLVLAERYGGLKLGPAAEKQHVFVEGFKLQMDFLAQKTNSRSVQLDYDPKDFSKYHVENMFKALQAAKDRAGYDPKRKPPQPLIANPHEAMTFSLSERLIQVFQAQTSEQMLTSDAVKMIKALGYNKSDYRDAMYKEIEKFQAAVLEARQSALTAQGEKDFQKAVGGKPDDDKKPKFEVQVDSDGPDVTPGGKYQVKVDPDADGPKGKYEVRVETNEDQELADRYAAGEPKNGANLGAAQRVDPDFQSENAKAADESVHIGSGSTEDKDSKEEVNAEDKPNLREGDREDEDSRNDEGHRSRPGMS